MARFKRTRITTATHEFLAVRPSAEVPSTAICERCGEPATWLNLRDAAAVRGISTPEILELITNDRLHHRESRDGHLLICLSSVVADRASAPESKTE
jgi:hypothetical protein